MGYTVKDFIDSNKFPGMKLISDNSGINREIKGARIIAVPDMEKFLMGGELLLTSLMVYEKLDERMMLSHLEELNKKQVSGFVVKRIQNTAHLNALFETLLRFCEEHGIPVLEIPQNLSYWPIIKYLLLQIFNIEIAKAVYYKMTRDEVSRLFAMEISNDRLIRNMLDKVGRILGNPVTLYVYASDKKMVYDFLSSEGLEERLVDGCMEKNLPYRRITGKDKNAYVWMEAKKYIDANENTAIITLHNEKIIQNTVIKMERELIKKEQDMAKQYWDMVSLLTTVLNHNQLVESGYQDDISFYTKQVYLQLQKNYPEYGITDEEITSVAHLAPIHDIGNIKVPIEILNKNGKLTDEEMNVVKQHPLVGAAMTQRFPEGITTEKLNKYSYEICRHHHERYDGSGYPDGLKGNAIPMCAQVVGIVDAYDALINDRPYKRKYEPEEAIRMISNGECGAFSKKLIQCLTAAAKQPEWLKVTKSQARQKI